MGKTHVITSVINITLSRDDLFEFANMLINADFKKAWLTAQEVTEVFGIPYANVKSAQWRKESIDYQWIRKKAVNFDRLSCSPRGSNP